MKKRLSHGVLYALFLVLFILQSNSAAFFGSEKADIAQCVKDRKLEQSIGSTLGVGEGTVAIMECWNNGNLGSCFMAGWKGTTAGLGVVSTVWGFFSGSIKAQCTKEVQSQNWLKPWRW